MLTECSVQYAMYNILRLKNLLEIICNVNFSKLQVMHFHKSEHGSIAVVTRQAMYVWRNNETRSCNYCCGGKAISITYSECGFIALVIQHAMRMRHIVICRMSGFTIFFSTLPHKRQDFRKKKMKKKMLLSMKRLFWFSRQILSDFSLQEELNKIRSKMYIGLQVKHPLFLLDLKIKQTWIFFIDFRKILKYEFSWKSVHWKPSCSTRTGGRTGRQTWRS